MLSLALFFLPTLRLPLKDDADNLRELAIRRAMSWLDFQGTEDDRDIFPEVASDCSPCENIKLRPDTHEFGFGRAAPRANGHNCRLRPDAHEFGFRRSALLLLLLLVGLVGRRSESAPPPRESTSVDR